MPKQPTKKNQGLSDRAKTISVVVVFVVSLFIPILFIPALILMWRWTNWPKWLKIVITIPVALFFTLLILAYSFQWGYLELMRPFEVKGNAMSPGYENGEYLMTRVSKQYHSVNRSDVVVFKHPQTPDYDYLFRVVGLPGEEIVINEGAVYINGQKLDEGSYLKHGIVTEGGDFLKKGVKITIPAEHYFVMGDNRGHSSDGRKWGFVPKENIVAKTWFCYWNCR